MNFESFNNNKRQLAAALLGVVAIPILVNAALASKKPNLVATNTTTSSVEPTITNTPAGQSPQGATPTKTTSTVQSSTGKTTPTPTLKPTITPTPTSAPAGQSPQGGATATPTPSQLQDSEAPTTNIYYPQNDGELSYKIDGKVCIVALAPSDNVSHHSEIVTRYAFDGNSMSDYASGRAYMCTDSLSNGSHSFKYQSKDKAGNEESEKSINFTVNIPEN